MGKEPKQPHLNGAYYGPSIPPPPQTYHRHGRSRGGGSSCCCCNPFTCLCSCLMNCICTCIFQIICTLLVIAAVLIFVLWLIFRPNMLVFHASNATLTQFDLNNNTLRYNLAVNLTIRNPNSRVGVYYDGIEARAVYKGQRFASTELQPFYQGTKNTSFSTAEFNGQHLVVLGSGELSDYFDERTAGVYEIDVQLYLRIRMMFWFVKSGRWRPRIDCNGLRVPLSGMNGTTSNEVFESTRCSFDW